MNTPFAGPHLHHLFASCLTILSAATPVAGTYEYYDVKSDVGIYAPVAMGQHIQLSACGSTFHTSQGSQQSYSICELETLSHFTLTWRAFRDGTYYDLGTYTGTEARSGVNISVSTGDNSFFNRLGSYCIGLYVKVANNVEVPLPFGSIGLTGNNGHLGANGYSRANGTTNYGYSSGFVLELTDATPVSEPSSVFLLLPAISMIYRALRRKTTCTQKP